MTIDTNKINSLFEQVQSKDMEHIAGLNQKGQLVSLGWHGRKVDSNLDESQLKQLLIHFLTQQQEEVNQFNITMELPLKDRTAVALSPEQTFEEIYSLLRKLIQTEAYAFERAKQKISNFTENPPTTPAKMTSRCEDIKKAIDTCMSCTEDDDSKIGMFAALMGHAATKSASPSVSAACQQALIKTLNGLRPALKARKKTPPPQASTATKPATPVKKQLFIPREISVDAFKEIQQTAYRKANYNTLPQAKEAWEAVNHFVEAVNKADYKSGSPQKLEDFIARNKANIKQCLRSKTQKLPEYKLMYNAMRDAIDSLDARSKDYLHNALSPSASGQPPAKSNQPAVVPKQTASPVPTLQKRNTGISKSVNTPPQIPPATRPDTPVKKQLFIPREISVDAFKEIQQTAYRKANYNTLPQAKEAWKAVNHFVEAVNKADYKSGSPQKLEDFIARNRDNINQRLSSKTQKLPEYKLMYNAMQDAIDSLDARSKDYIHNALSSPATSQASAKPKQSTAVPVKTASPVPPSQKRSMGISESDKTYLSSTLPPDKINTATFDALKAFRHIEQYATRSDQKVLCTLGNFCLLIKADEFSPSFKSMCYRRPKQALDSLHVRINLARDKLNPYTPPSTPDRARTPPQTIAQTAQPAKSAHLTPPPTRTFTTTALKISPPPLENWGNTCFINAYTNYLMLSLDEQDIEALKQLTIDPQDKASSLALEVRDVVVKLWEAYRQTPPAKNVQHLQSALLCAFTRCGNAQRGGNKSVDQFFADAFPKKSEQQLAKADVSFSDITQHDVTELQAAMYDLLLSRIPSRGTVVLNKTKSAEFNGQSVLFNMNSEELPIGFDIRVRDWSGKTASSMHEGLTSFNSKFDLDGLTEWSPEQLKAAGVTHPPTYVQRLKSEMEDRLIIGDDTEKLIVKIQPFSFSDTDGSNKLTTEAIDLFEKDGDPLEYTVTNLKTKQTKKAIFKPRCIACHQGKTLSSGHYFAISFDEKGNATVHNDSVVCDFKTYLKNNRLDESMSVTDFLRYQGASPYIIDYRRIS